ncbi:MAG TPA: hypothetical protein DGG95_00755 [Cytophagales bacterium]|jgi:hypothetical protein|nr:hypothetical protein [Cytophagales bacterium]
MEKSQRIGSQIYGYTVCLVAVITFLITITSLVNAIIDKDDPLHSGWNPAGSPSLASFDNYKMDVLKNLPQSDSKGNIIPDDEKLKAMFEAAKADKIQSVNHQAYRSIVISSLLILVSATLFVTHWRWLKKMRLES